MKKFILMYLILFLIGCGGNSISSPTGNNSNTGNNTTNNNNSNKTESIKIKLKIKGESNSAFFVKHQNKYANEISIQANGKINTFKSDFNGGYYLSDNSSMGKKIDTRSYLSYDNLYTTYNTENKEAYFNAYIWIGNGGELYLRKSVDITLNLKDFDSNTQTTALITLTFTPDNDSYTYTLDGYE